MRGKKIEDKFTNLKVSNQRKWQLRHPKEQKEITKRFDRTLKRRVYRREYLRKTRNYGQRRLGAKSYQEERICKHYYFDEMGLCLQCRKSPQKPDSYGVTGFDIDTV